MSQNGKSILRDYHLAAALPSGRTLVPGGTTSTAWCDGTGEVDICAGPDGWGRCPSVLAGVEPACRGAVWHRRDSANAAGWAFTFTADDALLQTSLCPAAILQPLGGLVYAAAAQLGAAP